MSFCHWYHHFLSSSFRFRCHRRRRRWRRTPANVFCHYIFVFVCFVPLPSSQCQTPGTLLVYVVARDERRKEKWKKADRKSKSEKHERHFICSKSLPTLSVRRWRQQQRYPCMRMLMCWCDVGFMLYVLTWSENVSLFFFLFPTLLLRMGMCVWVAAKQNYLRKRTT